jgi:hypothetical protein
MQEEHQRPCRRAGAMSRAHKKRVLVGVTADPPFFYRVRSCRVLRRGNISNRIAATLIVACCKAAVAADFALMPVAAPAADNLPDAAQSIHAYLQARQWVDDYTVPPLTDAESRLPIENATGVFVILRRNGRVLGSAGVVADRGQDAAMMVRRAVGRALGQALGDPAAASLPDEMRGGPEGIGRMLTLEMEIAGPLEPLLGQSYDAILRQVEPGLHGVAMRRGGGVGGDQTVALFPSQLRMTNSESAMNVRLPALAGEVGVPAGDVANLRELRERHGVSVHRFRTTHLAQHAPDRSPYETFRGDILVPEHAVTASSLVKFADDLARHLLASVMQVPDDALNEAIPDADGDAFALMGDYRPVADMYRPLVAPPLEQALAAFALARYADAPQVDSSGAKDAMETSLHLLRNLSGDHALRDLNVCAVVLYAACELQVTADPELVGMLASAAETLRRAAVDTTFADRPPHLRALLAGAMARSLQHEAAWAASSDEVRAAIDAAWAGVPEHRHVDLLPWISWAQIDLAAANGGEIDNLETLRRMREVLDHARLGAEAAPDLLGGFALTGDGAPAGSLPTSQSVRPAAFLATMLCDERLTPADELAMAVARHLQTMRFLIQLSVREELARLLRHPARAAGGLRNAQWDSDQPKAAQAMGLLAAVETLWSLERLE